MEKRRTIGATVIVSWLCNGVAALVVDPDYYVSPNGDNGWDGEYPTHEEGTNHGHLSAPAVVTLKSGK